MVPLRCTSATALALLAFSLADEVANVGGSAADCVTAGDTCILNGMAVHLTVNASRLWAAHVEMANIGGFVGPEGSFGVCREALTDEDAVARQLLDHWAAKLQLKREIDYAGNTYYRRPGRGSRGATVAIGSHVDSQPAGGRFDGIYGVLAGLEVLRTIAEDGIELNIDVELVNWSNEEGSRFGPPMMGSGVATGQLNLETVLATPAREDPQVTFGDELSRHGLRGHVPANVTSRNWLAYLEAHIEQGPMLEDMGRSLGIVTGGQGQRVFSVEVMGFEGHSGTVPMASRSDALVCASAMVVALRNLAVSKGVLATVGSMTVHPGSFNTIPGRVTFIVDMRTPDTSAMESAEAQFRAEFAAIAEQEKCASVSIMLKKGYPPQPFDESLTAHLHAAATEIGVPAANLISGAGHDAVYVATQLPAAMIFVPCARGISHNPRESAKASDLAIGAEAILRAVRRISQTYVLQDQP